MMRNVDRATIRNGPTFTGTATEITEGTVTDPALPRPPGKDSFVVLTKASGAMAGIVAPTATPVGGGRFRQWSSAQSPDVRTAVGRSKSKRCRQLRLAAPLFL